MKKQLGTSIGDVNGDMKYRIARSFRVRMLELREKLANGGEILPEDIFE